MMLMAPSGDDESHSGADATLSSDAVEAINKAKAAVEALPGCAGKVSCADILAMAARDVVSLVTKHRPIPLYLLYSAALYRPSYAPLSVARHARAHFGGQVLLGSCSP